MVVSTIVMKNDCSDIDCKGLLPELPFSLYSSLNIGALMISQFSEEVFLRQERQCKYLQIFSLFLPRFDQGHYCGRFNLSS